MTARRLGHSILSFLEELGAFSKMMGRVFLEIGGLFKRPDLFFTQCVRLGIQSAPLVMFVGVFTGAVTGWQSHYQMKGYLPFDLIGPGAYKAITLELGPVLTALIIAGRVAASVAAELGTMKVTEQIDAMESLAISSTRYLALPRIAAMTFMMPVLVIQANFVAIWGAAVVTTTFLGLTPNQFWGLIPVFFNTIDIISGLIKSLFFGMSSAMIGCYVGFSAEGGAEGVGDATIQSFVWACLTILVLDFVFATILF